MWKLAAALFALLFWASPAAATLAMDGTPQTGTLSGAAASTVTSAAFTSSLTNDILVVDVVTSNATSSTVTGVTCGALTLARRGSSFTGTTATFNVGDFERWWVLASSAVSSQTCTATLSIVTTSAAVIVYAINGANTTTPFDVNVSLPKTNTNLTASSTAPTVTGISTTNANTILLSSFITPGNAASVPFTEPSGFTLIGDSNGFSGSPNFLGGAIQSDRNIVAATQSSISVTYGTSVANWMMLVDAIQVAGGAAAQARSFPLMGYGAQ